MPDNAENNAENAGPLDAVVAGHLCLDIIPTLLGQNIEFRPGTLVEAGAAAIATGGAVANTGLALHRLGIEVRLIGKIGDDLFADAVRRSIASHGMHLSDDLVTSPGEPTSYSIILSPPGADRMFLHAPGCNATFDEHDIDYSAVAEARLFHFGYPPLMQKTYANGGVALASLFRVAKATGVTTSLDFSLPDRRGPAGAVDWEALLCRTLPFVDICAPSVDELLLMLRPNDYQRLLDAAGQSSLVDFVSPALVSSLGEQLCEIGAAVVVVKMGHRGLYLRTADTVALSRMGRAAPADRAAWAGRELWAPCFAVDVAGTTGSGDATIAGFLTGVLRGLTPEECAAAACAVGACSVEAADALSGVRSWDDTCARRAAGWPRLPSEVSAPGWQWDERLAVWRGPADRAD